MKKIFQILLLILLMPACNKKEERIPEVTFTFNISDFNINTKDYTDLKSQQESFFDDFTHKYPSGSLTFVNSENMTFYYNTEPYPIDKFSVTLPVGNYSISGEAGLSDPLGANTMSFTLPLQDITIEESTTEIDISVTPTCALFIITDEKDLLDSAYINDPNRPLYIESVYRYSYFKPESGNRVYLTKKEGASLNFSTGNLQVGYIYKIIVTDDNTSQTIILNPDFTISDLITW